MIPLLALDLGTLTGFSYRRDDGIIASGTWKLAKSKELTAQRKLGRDRTSDCRLCVLIDRVQEVVNRIKLVELGGIIGFEDVQFSSYTAQTQLWSSFRTAVWTLGCTNPNLRIEAVPVGTLKKFATGSGNATKDMMAVALRRKHPEIWNHDYTPDDNEVDARHLLNYLAKLA